VYNNLTDVLTGKGVDYETSVNKPEEIKIRCFSGLHEDSNPSLSINLDKEVFNCFSCGYSGSITKLIKDLGVTNYNGPDSSTKQGFKLLKIKNKLDKLRVQKEVNLPEPRALLSHDFKGIGASTLQDFGVFITEHYELSDYVCIPVYQNNKLKFIEGRYKASDNPKGRSKYMRLPEGSSVKEILFPLDKVEDFSTVILVEGIFDAINLHQLGYNNALCIFGTNNFTTKKVNILDELGCRHAIIMFDGDNAGRTSAKKVSAMFDKSSIKNSIVSLPEGTDPGVLTKTDVEFMLSKIM
jgi:5S rRNA maturation endonuclease (ribonuclease M5)